MDKVFLVKYGEIALKGLNKPYFERMLLNRIKVRLKSFNVTDIYKSDGIIYVKVDEKESDGQIIKEIKKVFGIAYISLSYETGTDMKMISESAVEYVNTLIKEKKIKTFKVETRRGYKQFPLKSPEISSRVGAAILKDTQGISVDVHQPDTTIYVDVRKEKSYIYSEKIRGYGGLPLGTNGKGLLLLSGGIDSPVAGWMMAKRGMQIEAVHFHSYPFTSERAQEKVMALAEILTNYCGEIKIYHVNLLNIQQKIAEKCPESELTILSRRFMMKISERIAESNGCDALITGESMGQVASQTIQGLIASDNSVRMLVTRPLIALDKVDIMDTAKEIGTYETSILPYEDCCTVFLPKHPATKPKLGNILKSELLLDGEVLIEEAIEEMEVTTVEDR